MTTFPELTSLVPLDYTYVVYDPTDLISAPLALLTLSPFFLFSAYATLIIINRPLSVVNLFIGQLANEGLNKVLKKTLKAGRPWVLGDGYGMPSSHSQFVAYSSSFMLVHLACIYHHLPFGFPHRHRRTPTSRFTRYTLSTGLILWPLLTGYSRYRLHYHSPTQVLAGLAVGSIVGALHAVVTEVVPLWYPTSSLGRLRARIARKWEEWPIEGWGGWGAGGRETGRWLDYPDVTKKDVSDSKKDVSDSKKDK